MFRVLLLAHIFLICEPAFAKPLTLVEFRDEFLKREFKSIKIAYIDTHPTMSAATEDQGFEAVLRECSDVEGTCEAARFTACRDLPGYSRIEALELTNRMNAGFDPGTAYAKDTTSPTGICVRYHITFRGDDAFGLPHIFDWQLVLEAFTQSVDSDLNSRIAADLRTLVQP